MTSTGRINYIDELKGFILCLVCLGHIAYSELSYAMNWMSLMRMFTFFFLSGLLFSRRRFPTFKDYAISKTKHLLFPYIWLSLFFLIITFQIYSGNIDEASRGPLFIKIENILSLVGITSNFICSLCANFFKIFILGNSSIWATPLWFVFTLWTVSLLYAFIDERCKNKIPLILISIICIGAIGWGLRNNHNIPYNLGASCTAYVYYAFGSIYKRKVKNFIDKLGNWEIFGLSILAILLYSFIVRAGYTADLSHNDLGNNILTFYTGTFTGVIWMFLIFTFLNRIGIKIGIFRFISRNALIILPLHYYVIKLINYLNIIPFSHGSIYYFLISSIVVIIVCFLGCILFRTQLYMLLGKEKISFRECFKVGSINSIFYFLHKAAEPFNCLEQDNLA